MLDLWRGRKKENVLSPMEELDLLCALNRTQQVASEEVVLRLFFTTPYT